MSLWDPEAAGNAAQIAQYLRLSEIALFEIRNAPFIGANSVLVPNSETGNMMMRRMFGPVLVLSWNGPTIHIQDIVDNVFENEKMFFEKYKYDTMDAIFIQFETKELLRRKKNKFADGKSEISYRMIVEIRLHVRI